MAKKRSGRAARARRQLSKAIREAHHSSPVARTTRKYGAARGRRQAIAIGFAKRRRKGRKR